jgi:large subunit ribosomal protein L35
MNETGRPQDFPLSNRRHYLEHKSSRLTRRLAGDKIVFKGDAKVIRKMLGI